MVNNKTKETYASYMEAYVTSHPATMSVLLAKDRGEEYRVLLANEAAVCHFLYDDGQDASTFFGSIWDVVENLLGNGNETARTLIQSGDDHHALYEIVAMPLESEEYDRLAWVDFRIQKELAEECDAKEYIEEKYISFIQNNYAPIVTVNEIGAILHTNEAAIKAIGQQQDEMEGRLFADLIVEKKRKEFNQFLKKAFTGISSEMEGGMYVRREDHPLAVHIRTIPIYANGKIAEVHLVLQDSMSYFKNSKKWIFLSYHDPLTGLWNRKALKEHFEQDAEEARLNKEHLSFVHIDLDRFKTINDALGRNGADDILKAIAERLKIITPRTAKLYRNGGDEFIITISSQTLAEVERFAQKLLSDFTKPFYYDHQEYFISASIGISVFPEDGESLEGLLHQCERAILYVKDRGRAHYRFYQEEMNEAFPDTALMEAHLRRAIEFDEFEIHYQPQVNLRTGHISSFEALLRWNNRKFGFVSPATFIPLAEEAGLIHKIGEWVLDRVCGQLKEWADKQYRQVRIAVNISPQQFRTGTLADNVKAMIDKHCIAPSSLEVEITESALMHMNDTLATLNELKDIGVAISVDDFGTGYSSLSYLKLYPIDIIKIDRSFVQDIESDKKNEAIAKTIINLAHNLGMEVIAEGVEKELQVKILLEADCQKAQGFLFSKAVPADEIVHKYFLAE